MSYMAKHKKIIKWIDCVLLESEQYLSQPLTLKTFSAQSDQLKAFKENMAIVLHFLTTAGGFN